MTQKHERAQAILYTIYARTTGWPPYYALRATDLPRPLPAASASTMKAVRWLYDALVQHVRL